MTPSRQKRIARHARTARVRAAMHPGFTGVLFDVWRRARTIWMELCDKFETSPAALAACWPRPASAAQADHRLALQSRKPRPPAHPRRRPHAPRHARCPHAPAALAPTRQASRPRLARRPETWRKLRFRIFPRTAKPCDRDYAKPATPRHFYDSLPLAHRLQALRLVLRNPQAAARRAAFRLARLAAADRTSNKPRGFVVRDDAPLTRAPTFGEMIVESAFEKLTPVLADRLDAWSRRTEPG